MLIDKFGPKGKTAAILCHDGYDFKIRSLKRALEILLAEQDEDLYLHKHGEGDKVYPLDAAIGLIRTEIWKEYDSMVCQKAFYDNDEWLRMKEAHIKQAKANSEE